MPQFGAFLYLRAAECPVKKTRHLRPVPSRTPIGSGPDINIHDSLANPTTPSCPHSQVDHATIQKELESSYVANPFITGRCSAQLGKVRPHSVCSLLSASDHLRTKQFLLGHYQ